MKMLTFNSQENFIEFLHIIISELGKDKISSLVNKVMKIINKVTEKICKKQEAN
jgi:hypothetical protein